MHTTSTQQQHRASHTAGAVSASRLGRQTQSLASGMDSIGDRACSDDGQHSAAQRSGVWCAHRILGGCSTDRLRTLFCSCRVCGQSEQGSADAMPSCFHSCLWIALCTLLLCTLHPPASVLLLPAHALSPPNAVYELPVTGGYKTVELGDANAFPALMRVESPAALRGDAGWSSAPFTGPMFVNTSCTPGSDCRVRFQIMLPNRADSAFGCSLRETHTSGGELISAATMLLIERHGGCGFGDKEVSVQTLGAGAVMFMGCDTAPPSNCPTGLEITLASKVITIPATYMQFADAARWRAYLTARDDWLIAQNNTAGIDTSSSSTGPADFASSSSGMAGPGCPVCNCSAQSPAGPSGDWSEPLIVSFPATGPLHPQHRDTLHQIVSNLMQADPVNGVVDSLSGTYTALRGWTTIVRTSEQT